MVCWGCNLDFNGDRIFDKEILCNSMAAMILTVSLECSKANASADVIVEEITNFSNLYAFFLMTMSSKKFFTEVQLWFRVTRVPP